MNLSGNTCFITGGSAGIGLALAEALLAEGSEVVVCGRSEERLARAKARCPALHVVRCDITVERDVDEVVALLEREHGDLNVLVNNAAIIGSYAYHRDDESYDQLEREIRTNVLAPMRLCKRLLPLLTRRATGALVNVTTGTAWVPMPAAPGYSASKAAMHSLTQSLRYQLRDTNLRVFEVIPPLVDTEMARSVSIVDPKHTKMSPEALARRVMLGLRRDELEMRIGMNWLLWMLHRIWPAMALRVLQNE